MYHKDKHIGANTPFVRFITIFDSEELFEQK